MADGLEKPPFDPSQPFQAVDTKPPFDPSQPFSPVESAGTDTGTKFQQRQHSYREALRSGAPEIPAGQAAPGPDLSGERLSGAEIASQWGDVGKGLAKGVPAAVSGGLLGDIEQPIRQLTKEFGVPQQTWVPTTTEGGYLGPRGLGVMDAAANPREAAGMSIASMAVPGAIGKIAGRGKVAAPTVAETAPFEMHPDAPVGVVRPQSGARLLPPETPHTLPPETETIVPRGLGPERADAGAAAVGGPLNDVSHATIDRLRAQLAADGWTPWTLEQRLEEMSPHQFLAEVSPNIENQTQKLATYAGESKNNIVRNVGTRATEAKERLANTFDDAFGESQNLSVKRRELTDEQKRVSGPFWKAFDQLEVSPTPEIDALIPRLQAAGAFGGAKKLAAIEGKRWTNAFDFGEEGVKSAPTPASWQLVKEALDAEIENSFNARGEATKRTRAYTQLKNDLVSAIDNHPDENVAGVWKAARDSWAGPAQLKSAHQLGKRLLTESIDKDELPFMLKTYSPAQKQALAEGLRTDLENKMGRAGPQERRVINQILSPNNQAKIREIVGEEKANQLFKSIEHEHVMHDAPTRLYKGSQTANRMVGAEEFGPQGSWHDPENIAALAGHAVGAVLHPGQTAGKAVTKFAGKKYNSAREAAAAKYRDEISGLYMLQGPERDAVLRWLIGDPNYGSNVVGFKKSGGTSGFARGGRVQSKMNAAQIFKLNREHAKLRGSSSA